MNEIVDYYDSIAKIYDEDRFSNTYGKFIDQQERLVLNKLLSNSNEKILDLACGSGRLLNYANLGSDASAEMIKLACIRFPEIEITLNDAEKTIYEDNSIDTIISFHFFMHLEQNKIDKILDECNRILKVNGRVIFDIPSKKRRNLFKYKSNEWHGAFSCTLKELKSNPNFKISKSYGIVFFPIHRFPKITRKFFMKLDLILANSFLREYSSYLIIEFHKK